jgi:HEPN superfamily AbiU2-like protein
MTATEQTAPPDDLAAEIEIFRKDEEAAQQFLFAYLGIRAITAERPDVLAAVNRNPMFWISSKESLLISTFIWLGRVFDQRSAHNLNLLLRMVERNLPVLNRDALRERKARVITPEQAAEYVKEKHEMTVEDVRSLRNEVRGWRKIYEPVYREIRDHFAHNKHGVSDFDALLAKTNIEEMKRMFGFLHALHEGLVELYLNGRNPLPLPDIQFVLPPAPKPQRQYYPGEEAYREARAALLSLLPKER